MDEFTHWMRKAFFDIVTLNSKRKACKGYEYE